MNNIELKANQILTNARIGELIDILDESFTQLQPRDCTHLIGALLELRIARKSFDKLGDGLSTALNFVSREMLDTGVRETIKECRRLARPENG